MKRSNWFGPGMKVLGGAVLACAALPVQAQNVINSNTTIYNSLCVGFDCAGTEAYGSDTIRMKENNLRLHFDDTSTAAGFPNNDWRLIANDQGSSGISYLAIEDSTAGNRVFQVNAGARRNSLVVDAQGDIGIGTGSPSQDIQVVVGNTPTLRLEQDGSAGFAAQTWDIAGNEAGFFIRDATGGSQLPFRIIPGANSSSLVIDDDNDIGIGAGTNPEASLHVERSDGTARVFIQETSGTTAARGLLEMENNGTVFMSFYDTSIGADTVPGAKWNFQNQNGQFRITTQPGGGGDIEFRLNEAGDLFIEGELTTTGSTCGGGCDAVFDPDYDRMSLEEHAALMWEKGHLPVVGPTVENAPMNLTDKVGRMLNALEHAHIYIDQLHQQQQQSDEVIAALTDRLNQLESRIPTAAD